MVKQIILSVRSVAGGQDVIVKFWVYCMTMSIQVVVSYVKLYSLISLLRITLLASAHCETHIDLNLSEPLRVFPSCSSNTYTNDQSPSLSHIATAIPSGQTRLTSPI